MLSFHLTFGIWLITAGARDDHTMNGDVPREQVSHGKAASGGCYEAKGVRS